MTGPAGLEWWLNLMAGLGILILAVPVWQLNRRKKKLTQIRSADLTAVDNAAFRGRVRDILLTKREREAADWRRIDEACLIAGYALLLGTAVLRVAAPLVAG